MSERKADQAEAQTTRRIVIVGGGTAGWLTAAIIAARHRASSGSMISVTLLESPDVPTIGVGEGTWPTMRLTLQKIGVSETDFFRECDASFKQGSRFNGWVNGSNGDYYFHPFMLPEGFVEADILSAWQTRYPNVPFAELVSHQPRLCMQGRAPKQGTTPEFAAVNNYGYHLDAGKFGVFLRKHCIEHLGVHHILDHVTKIDTHENGDIAALHTKSGNLIEAELFVDCTGIQSLLLGKHYGIPFKSQKEILFNNRALAVQVPYAENQSPIASQTNSTAQSNGWIWDIGLPTRRGIGHVYSSAHTSDDAAEQELRTYIQMTGGGTDIPTPRKLEFEPGYREKFWHRNCVAIGLSAGFIEPLEASALALVELSATMLSDQMPATREEMDILARRFNDSFHYRWQRVIEFLKLHYVLSVREESAYWHDNRAAASIPDSLRDLLTIWRHHPPSHYDFPSVEEVFPAASYQYILYGMGFKTAVKTGSSPSQVISAAEQYFSKAARLGQKMLPALPTNRALLEDIAQRGLPKM